MTTRAVVLFAVLTMTGCTVVEPEPRAPFGVQCPLCGNSGEALHYLIHEANLAGVPNDQDIAITTNNGRAEIFDESGEKYELHVEGGRIFGVHSDGSVLEDDKLEGATIRFERNGSPVGSIYIVARRIITAPVGPPDPIEVYTLNWLDPGSTTLGKNACVSQADPEDPELHAMQPEETLVFEGTRIRPITLTVDPLWQPEWFSFGCAGHTLAKLRLTGNTELTAGFNAAVSQATMKMFAADYCGDGYRFTVAGTPLRWIGGLVTDYYSSPHEIEARWTQDGASCLMVPRLRYHPIPNYPNVEQEIAMRCSIPSCSTNQKFDDFDGALVISANVLP